MINPDIDIDFFDKTHALIGLDCVPASVAKNGEFTRHPSGVYFQDIPVNPMTELAAFDYHRAEELGYFKVDFLNSSIYAGVENEAHLQRLLDAEPDWTLFEHKSIVEMLNHIRDHFGIVQFIQPKSIDDLSVVLALIRPGKRHLMGLGRLEIDAEIWTSDGSGYSFKRAHAVSYAATIVVQLNLICENMARQMEAKIL